ncbi:MAG: hypothetical protein KDC36_00215 [Thermoleophilia bacterium]|nr:hypothetical protein [Thermoleophilia bacterium]
MPSAPRQALTLAVLAAMAVPGAAGAATDPGLVRVLTPSAESVTAATPTVRVVLARRGGARIDAVYLNGRRVRPAMRRRGRNRLELVLSAGAHPLRAGRNTVAVASHRGAARDHDAVPFTRARPVRDLGHVAAPGAGTRIASAPVRAVLAVPHPVSRVRVWLNGRLIPESQWEHRWARKRILLDLTASDGLRHGPNKLRMLTTRGTRMQLSTRTFTVTGAAPLAAPGRHARIHAGTSIRLDGSASRVRPTASGTARTASTDLDYHWEITNSPEGSSATLDDPTSSTPTLSTDRPGLYTATLTVSLPHIGTGQPPQISPRSAPADVNIIAQRPGLTPVSSRDNVITIGDVAFEGPHIVTPGPVYGHVVVISRSTGKVLADRVLSTGGTDDEADVQNAMNVHGVDCLVLAVVNDPQGALGGRLSPEERTTIGVLLHASGLLPSSSLDATALRRSRTGMAAVVGWLTPGETWTMPGPALRGYIGQDATGTRTYLTGDIRRFTLFSDDTPSASNTIVVDGTSYPAQLPPGSSGGYQVLRLDPVTLAPVSNTVVAHTPVAARIGTTAANDLASALSASGIRGDLVFVASLGTPGSTALPAGTIEALGGTPEPLVGMRNSGDDRYGLVYSPAEPAHLAPSPAIEVGSVIGRHPSQPVGQRGGPVQASGFLRRQSSGRMTASAGAPGEESGSSFAEIAYRAPTPWPHSSTPAERAALAWFAQRLSLPGDDPRISYTRRDLDISARLTMLNGLSFDSPPAPTTGFARTDFDAIKADLQQELLALADVNTLFASLRETYGPAGLQNSVDIGGISQSIQNQVSPPAATQVYDLQSVLTTGLTVAGKAFPPPTGTAFGFVAEALTMGAKLDGAVSATDPTVVVSQDATALQADVPRRIATMVGNLDEVQNAIVTDRGRLMSTEQQITGGSWVWNSVTQNRMRTAFRWSIAREAWISLVRTSFYTYLIDTDKANRKDALGGMTCITGFYDGTSSQMDTTDTDVFLNRVDASLSWSVTGRSARVGRVIARTGPLDFENKYGDGPQTPGLLPMTSPVFAPLSETSGSGGAAVAAGIYPPHLAGSIDERRVACSETPAEYDARQDGGGVVVN